MTGNVAVSAEHRVILSGISWDTYEQLLTESAKSNRAHLAYNEGTLEIMSPLGRHEHATWLLAQMIIVLAEEHAFRRKSMGALTCRRRDMLKGMEPDCCFYIEHEPQVREKDEIDLDIDPPPDLAVEVDMSSDSLNKFPIYEALGIPEIWRFDGGVLSFYALRNGKYLECEHSPTFPMIPLKSECLRFLELSRVGGEHEMIQEFRKWVKELRLK